MADPCPRRSESMRRPMMSTASSNSGHLAGMFESQAADCHGLAPRWTNDSTAGCSRDV
jgi:hypothetical protein